MNISPPETRSPASTADGAGAGADLSSVAILWDSSGLALGVLREGRVTPSGVAY